MKAKVDSIYTHYKNGHQYNVLAIGKHSETGEEMVVYEALYDDPEFGRGQVWVRPRAMFEEMVEYEGRMVHRFSLVADDGPPQ